MPKRPPESSLKGLLLSALIFSVVIFSVGCSSNAERTLPYIGKHSAKMRTVNGKEVIDSIYHTVPDFKMLNQDSVWITKQDLLGKVYVVDFFFTACPSICPRMTNQLVRAQTMTGDLNDFVILSHTVDPVRDTPERMKAYAEKYRCDLSNWHFLYGERDVVYDLGMVGYYLSMGEAPDSPGGFIHSPTFVLVDQQGHIRGMYDGTQANEVEQMVEDVKLLLKKVKG